jgi:hypothetical protein
MVYKSSLYSEQGNELTIESFYFNISILDNSKEYIIINNDSGARVSVNKTVLNSANLSHIKAVSLVKYAYDISQGVPKKTQAALSIYSTMLQIVKVCGIHNSSYNSLIREAIGA